MVPTVQMANGAIRAELPVGSRRSDGPVGFAGPYGRNLMQAPPRIRGRNASSFAGPRGCRLGRSGPVGAAGLCPERPPGLLYHARAPLFGRGSMLQTRFCLCTQYCHWTRAGAISAMPIRAFRACGCCGPMPRRSPDSSATRTLLSLAVAVCYRRASACAHSTVATLAGNAHRACQMSRALIPPALT